MIWEVHVLDHLGEDEAAFIAKAFVTQPGDYAWENKGQHPNEAEETVAPTL